MENKLNRLYKIGIWSFMIFLSVLLITTLFSVIYYKEVGIGSTKTTQIDTILKVKIFENKSISKEKKSNIDTISVIKNQNIKEIKNIDTLDTLKVE